MKTSEWVSLFRPSGAAGPLWLTSYALQWHEAASLRAGKGGVGVRKWRAHSNRSLGDTDKRLLGRTRHSCHSSSVAQFLSTSLSPSPHGHYNDGHQSYPPNTILSSICLLGGHTLNRLQSERLRPRDLESDSK